MTAPVLLWLRRELRLADNPALAAALASQRPVLPVYVLDEATPGPWAPGGASRWWLHHSLSSLAAALARTGAPLVLRRGRIAQALPQLLRETGAVAIHAGQPIEPWAREAMADLQRAAGVPVHLHRTATLFDPDAIRTQAGAPYSVFTPFARACRAHGVAEPPLPAPTHIPAPPPPASDTLEHWNLLPTHPDWAAGLRATWTPGEQAAQSRLRAFAAGPLAAYAHSRDRPDTDGTSMLSPHLAFGEISARQLWHAAGDGNRHNKLDQRNPLARVLRPPALAPPHAARGAVARRIPPHALAHTTQPACAPGSAAAPACRSSMPACASSGRPAGCTTACA